MPTFARVMTREAGGNYHQASVLPNHPSGGATHVEAWARLPLSRCSRVSMVDPVSAQDFVARAGAPSDVGKADERKRDELTTQKTSAKARI